MGWLEFPGVVLRSFYFGKHHRVVVEATVGQSSIRNIRSEISAPMNKWD